jgi:hypothetical protein
MKRFVLVGVMLLGVIWLWLDCSNKTVNPLADNYDESQLFKVTVNLAVPVSPGFASVQIDWLVDKLGRGNRPSSIGPLDGTWGAEDIVTLSQKTSDGKYYTYQAIVQLNKLYGVGGILDWSGSDFSTYRWLTPSEQAGCPYYNYMTTNMSFTINSDLSITPGAN